MTTPSDKRQVMTLVANHHPVIGRAVQDLARKHHRDEAREWLLSSESDYAFATAGINPHSIRQQMI